MNSHKSTITLYSLTHVAYIHVLKTAISTQNEKQRQSVWSKLPDVPYYYSAVSVVDGVLLAIGGAEDELGTKKTSAICALDNYRWKHIGDMPLKCSWVDTLVLSDEKLVVVDGGSRHIWKVTGKGVRPYDTSYKGLFSSTVYHTDERFVSVQGVMPFPYM